MKRIVLGGVLVILLLGVGCSSPPQGTPPQYQTWTAERARFWTQRGPSGTAVTDIRIADGGIVVISAFTKGYSTLNAGSLAKVLLSDFTQKFPKDGQQVKVVVSDENDVFNTLGSAANY